MTDDMMPMMEFKDLAQVLDAYVQWICRWQTAVFFVEHNEQVSQMPVMPDALSQWCENCAHDSLTTQPVIERLLNLQNEIKIVAERVYAQVNHGTPPSREEYDNVISRFRAFIGRLRTVEQAFSAAASGIDPLTGLRSRTGMHDDLVRELNRFRRTGQPFCIAICDIDHFKEINDTFGHAAGDRVLSALSSAIHLNTRSFDEAYRIGGEEFLICLKNLDLVQAYAVLERLRIEVENVVVTLPEGEIVRATLSFGLAQADFDVDLDHLIDLADKALYRAKESGRNKVIVMEMGETLLEQEDLTNASTG